ncbi:phage tail protein [Rahnella sp. BCC 1045]|uniref:phage tail-collar fiber domain-containing protein n=1 Tax=Rahnella sp. BCC 1045 TaxID=2816251 RepID=UPI0020B77338|nr:phage tail protein [Rahnella sp. BCC 1045]
MATYKALLTTAGAAKIAAATAGGTQVNITQMAVGDGGGKLPTPDSKQTKLINEVYRAGLNRLSIDAKNSNYLVAELVIQSEIGGFWMREMGLYDADGVLIAVSNMAESYKPELAEGAGRLQTLRMVLIVSEINAIALSIDGSTVMATKDYVDDKLAEHEKSRNHPDGTLTAKGFVQLNSSVSSTSEVLAATPKAVKAANDNANGRVPSTRKINGKALSADQNLTAADVGGLPVITTVLGATNINTLNLGMIGLYVQSTGANATAANGYPSGSQAAGVLEVIPASWTGGVLQRYTVQNTGMVWTRALNASWNGTDGPWRDWVQASTAGSVAANTALGATDLNTVGFGLTAVQAVVYHQSANASATVERNYPEAKAGTLFVTGSAYGCQQMYITFDTCNVWMRGLSTNWNGKDGPWRPWVAVYGTNNKPTAADVGAWTAAQSAASEKALADEIATAFKIRTNLAATDTPNTLRGSGMFGHYGVPGVAAATTDKGYPMNGFVGVIFVTWGPNATQQIAFNNNGRQFTRSATGAWNGVDGPWSAWNEIYCQANKPTPADVGALPAGGTAVAATKLATARKIAGVAFDGSADINISAGNVGAYPQSGGNVGGYVNATYLSATQPPNPGKEVQGTFIGWNETGGQGESDFVNNRGGGVGGFIFRTVTTNNSTETGRVTFSGTGDVYPGRDINTAGYIYERSQRVYSPNNPPPTGAAVTGVRLSNANWTGQIGNNVLNYDNGQVLTGVQSTANYAINMQFAVRQVQVCIGGNWYGTTSL